MLGLGNILTKGGALLGFPNKYSFNFDGSNDYLDLGNHSAFNVGTGDFSVSAWINVTLGSGDAIKSIIWSRDTSSPNAGFEFQADDGSDRLRVIFDDGDPAIEVLGTNNSLSSNTWHHVVMTVNRTSGTCKLYIDGSLNKTQDISSTTGSFSNIGSTSIGARSSTQQRFDGLIDELALWHIELSADDVAKIGSKPVDFSKASTYATDRTASLKLWLRAGDKVLPESDASIARSDFYTDFDGTDDYVDVGSQTPINNLTLSNLSFGCWFKTSDTSKYLFGNQDGNDSGFSMEIKSDGKIRSIVRSASGSYLLNDTTSALNDDVWHHIMFTGNLNSGTASGSEGKIYIDGVYEDSASWNEDTTLRAGDSDFTIGTGAGNTSNEFEGQLSSLALYKTALDAQTISQMAKSRYTPMRDNRFSVVDFDGTDDFIDTGTGLPDITSGAFTISGWFNFDSVSATHWLWGRGTGSGSGYAIKFDTTPRLIAQSKTSSSYQYYASNYTFSVGEWYHIVFVHSGTGTTPKLYINGALNAGSGAWNSDIVSQSSLSFKIGSNEGTSNEFNGQIANVAWYSEAKDAEFVYAQYQKGITYNPSADTALEGLWRMGDDTSKAYPTIADSSSNSNDGTMTSMASDDIVRQMVAGYDMGAFESSSEELGAELNPNPTFSNFTGDIPDGWTVVGDDDAGNNISQGSAGGLRIQSDGTAIYAQLADVTTSGKIYKYSITLANLTDDDFNFNNAGTTFFTANGKSEGTYTGHFEAVSTLIRIIRLGNCDGEVTAFSLKEVLQSDLSDTYPAIIDVNEPVLGAETITNGTFDSDSSWTKGTGWTIGSGVATSDSSAQSATSYLKATAFTALDVNKTYKLSFRRVQTNTGGLRMLGLGGSDTTIVTYSTTTTGTDEVVYFKPSGANTQLWVTSLDGLFSGSVDNISLKEVSGNVGTMTNQDSADLVYSSVLPDQSFLTGVNSAYNFLDFDGTDAYVDTGSSYSDTFNDSFTVSLWIESNDGQGSTRNFAGTEGTSADYLEFRNVSTGKLSLIYRSDGGTIFTATTNDVLLSNGQNDWHHIVFVLDNTAKQVSIYFDGENKTLDSTDDGDFTGVTISAFDTSQNLYIGANNANGTSERFYKGSINQFAIWNKALSSSEISAIYTVGRHTNLLDSYSGNLKGYYAFGALDAITGLADTDSTIYDRSGNSNHGAPSGIATGDLKSPPNAEPNGYAKGDTNRSTTTP